jgi:hypothetical protein
MEYTPAALAESTAATTSTSMREQRIETPFATATRSDRRRMLIARRHDRRSRALPAAIANCADAVSSAPAAQAAISVLTVGSASTAARMVVIRGSVAIARSVRLTTSTSPRAWAMYSSKLE